MPLIGTLTSGVSAMRAFTKDLEVIGNNIANVNTYGFKGSKVSFSDSFSNTLRASSPSGTNSSNASAIQVGTGVNLSEVSTNFGQGTTTATGNVTDLAVSGNGFFVVKNPTNNEYFVTRAGNFHWDDQNYLVNDQGYRVQGDVTSFNQAATLPANAASTNVTHGTTIGDIKKVLVNQKSTKLDSTGATVYSNPDLKSVGINPDGTIVGTYSDQSTFEMGSVLLANFSDTSALMKQGGNLYTGFSAAGLENTSNGLITGLNYSNSRPKNGAGLGSISSQQLELANVDLTEQFSDMITVQRSFQASSRLISVSDQILEDIVNLKR